MKKIILLTVSSLICLLSFAQINTSEANYYTIKASNTQYYLDMAEGADHGNNSVTKMSARGTSFAQVWKIERRPDESYKITNAITGKSLDGSCSLSADGCQALTQQLDNSVGQRWEIVIMPGGFYKIQLASNRKMLTSTAFQPVTLSDRMRDNQQFEIVPSNLLIKTEKFTDLRGNQTVYKNQAPPSGDRGGCTYFGSTAALEAAYKRKGYGELDLSEEFMAISSKMFYLHPNWNDIVKPNQRENQFAGTQGGGSIALLASGLKIPTEAAVPYAQYAISENWASLDLKVCNDFNYATLNRFPQLKYSLSYGVSGFREIPVINAENLERVLKTGTEIKICIDNGEHCVLLVGYDKTDPANKNFIIKDSYNRQGLACYKKLQYFPYSEMSRLISAEYITEVTVPKKWDEFKFIGRWGLNFAGWTGTLDIYHIPGIMNYLLAEADNARANGGVVPDRRIGVFYDHTGAAFRVNGVISKTANTYEIVFWFDNSKPNLRWDELRGRKFTYTISADGNSMSGTHRDLDGSVYPGSARRQL